jgi:hypothetical protein
MALPRVAIIGGIGVSIGNVPLDVPLVTSQVPTGLPVRFGRDVLVARGMTRTRESRVVAGV